MYSGVNFVTTPSYISVLYGGYNLNAVKHQLQMFNVPSRQTILQQAVTVQAKMNLVLLMFSCGFSYATGLYSHPWFIVNMFM